MSIMTQAAEAASVPFEKLLQAAQAAHASPEAQDNDSSSDQSASPQQRLARKLQELFTSLGLQPGEQATLSVSETGDILADGHPQANEIETALNGQDGLKADLKQFIDEEGLFDPSPFFADARLEVKVAEDADLALLNWR
jgi:hypothetical protein